MKLYLIILLFVCFLVCAIYIYFYYRERVRLFNDLIYLCGVLSRNISFKKTTIEKIINDNLKSMGQCFKLVLKKKEYTYKILTREKADYIIGFFDSLGRGDVGYEVDSINYYKKEFEEMGVIAKEDLQKKGVLYFKLLIGLGLIICIILL